MGLVVEYAGSRGPVRAVDGLSLTIEGGGEALGIIGESGSGKTSLALALMRLLPRNATLPGRQHPVRGPGHHGALGRGVPAPGPLERHGHGVPGRHARAQPGHRRGRPGGRAAACGWHGPGRRAGTCRRPAGSRGLACGHVAAICARAVGWHAPAGDDRDGAHPRPAAAHPRRADQRPGRERPGTDHEPAQGAQVGAGHLDAVHHPRPGARERPVRPHRGRLRGPDPRGRSGGRCAGRRPAIRTTRGLLASMSRLHGDELPTFLPGSPPDPAEPLSGVPIRGALPAGVRAMRRAAAADGGGRRVTTRAAGCEVRP